jgi:DNA-binding response OmpR family regulator
MAKVLLAEDDETMVGLLTTLLQMDGFDVAALDADDDIPAAVELHCPEFLVLDVHLSHQNGLDVLDAIRKVNGNHRLHVIMISGLNVKDQALKRGADDFLLKPFMPDELMSLLRKNVKA